MSSDSMVEIRPVAESELDTVRRLHNSYTTSDESMADIRAKYSDTSQLLFGAYEDEEMIGFASGTVEEDGGVVLESIAVVESARRQGIGSALLDSIEEAAVSRGCQSVSLGSAGGYVDTFYVDNGYDPESILLRFDSREVAQQYRDLDYEICRTRVDDGTVKWYVDVDGFDPDFLQEVRDAFDDPEAVYIMEIELDDETSDQ